MWAHLRKIFAQEPTGDLDIPSFIAQSHNRCDSSHRRVRSRTAVSVTAQLHRGYEGTVSDQRSLLR